MKIKTGDLVKFSTPIGDKIGYVISIEGDNYLIKSNSFPFSTWSRKYSEIILKVDKI